MIYVVKSLFNSDITNGLYNGFIKSVEGTKIKENLKLIDVPGAYDIPGAVARNLNNEDCDNNSDCFWQNDITVTPHEPSQGLYLVEFNYSGTFDYSVTIPWIDYTINGSVIVNDYEN